MGDTNIMSEGIETLNTIKESLLELDNYKQETEQLSMEEKRLEKAIKSKEKDIRDEITLTLKKRKDEVGNTFDEQISKLKAKIRKAQNKKDKLKGAKVSERIEGETIDLWEENEKLSMDIKDIFKENKIPRIYNNGLYYSLYFPSSFSDVFIFILLMGIAFIGIPCGIYFGILPERKTIYLIAVYFITIFLVGGLYLFFNNISKTKYLDPITQVKQLRIQIRTNKKKIKGIKKSVLKDKDESSYGLEEIKQELMELDTDLKELEKKKQEAIHNFEDTTSVVITAEIKAKHQEELDELKADYYNIHQNLNQCDSKIKDSALYMANNYEAYVGKEFLKVEKIDQLIRLMEDNGLSTISEGVAFFHQEENQ